MAERKSEIYLDQLLHSGRRVLANAFLVKVVDVVGVEKVVIATPEGSATKIFVIAQGRGLVPRMDIVAQIDEIGSRTMGTDPNLKHRVVTASYFAANKNRLLPGLRTSQIRTVWQRQ